MDKKIGIIIPTKIIRKDILLNLLSQLDSLGLSENIFLMIDNSEKPKEILERFRKIKYKNFDNLGFGNLINQIPKFIKAEYYLIMNDDIIVYPEFIEDLLKGIKAGYDMVGPTSNYVGGIQSRNYKVSENNYKDLATEISKDYSKNYIIETSFLSGFLFLIKSELLEKYKIPESIKNFYTDNYLSYRLYSDGYSLGIIENCFIYHYGSLTYKSLGLDTYSQDFQEYLRIINSLKNSDIRIAGLLRTKNSMEYIKKGFVNKFLALVDRLYVVDTGSTDGTYEYYKELSKTKNIVLVKYSEKEDLERSFITELAYKDNYQWALWLDSDEIPDRYITKDYLRNLASNSIFPEVNSFVFRILTYWRGNTHHRIDGVWGNLSGARFFKLIKNKTSWITPNVMGLHCSPLVCLDNFGKRYTSRKILHYGYDSYEKAYSKFKFYSEIDKDKNTLLIGTPDYSHLIDESKISLIPVREKTVGFFCITKQDSFNKNFFNQLRQNFSLFDEIIIGIDDRSCKETIDLLKLMNVNYRLFKFKNFSQARNKVKKALKTDFIFFMDDDEILINPFEFMKLNELEDYLFLFEISNIIQEDNIEFNSYSVRLFPNDKTLKFKNKIHEVIESNKYKLYFAGKLLYNIKEKPNFQYYRQEILKDKTPLNMAKLMIDKAQFDKALKYLNKLPDSNIYKEYLKAYIYLIKAYYSLNKIQSFGSRAIFINKTRALVKDLLKEYLKS